MMKHVQDQHTFDGMIYAQVTFHSEVSDFKYVRCLNMFSNMPVSKDYLSETEIILFRTIFTKFWPFSPLSGIKPTFHSLITSENLPFFH